MSVQIANRIKLIPDHDVISIENETITLMTGKNWFDFSTENEMKFKERFRKDLWEQSTEPVIKMDKETFEKLDRRQVIVILVDTEGNEHIWGDMSNAVRFTSTTHLDRYTLKMTRQALLPIF